MIDWLHQILSEMFLIYIYIYIVFIKKNNIYDLNMYCVTIFKSGIYIFFTTYNKKFNKNAFKILN
jgi:hypothetical protein